MTNGEVKVVIVFQENTEIVTSRLELFHPLDPSLNAENKRDTVVSSPSRPERGHHLAA